MKQTYYSLPEEDRERMTRTEMIAMNWMFSALNSCIHSETDLAKRLECVPHGKKRFRLLVGQISAIMNDLTGTMPEKQKDKVRNMMHDMEIRLVPKMTPRDVSIVLSRKDAMVLFDLAKEAKCTTCMLDSEQCRKCELYKIMTAETPLEKYEGYLCPYNLAEWER